MKDLRNSRHKYINIIMKNKNTKKLARTKNK